MKLDNTNILLLVEAYGQDQWVGSPAQEKPDAPALGHYSFTTEDFSYWYNHFTAFSPPPLSPPTLATFNTVLSKYPNCNQIGKESDLDISWHWQLHP
ncbi:hypothetical protein [Aeromonas hydrophila]|uniref:hypothetical protein n=1 Tax=Aeromonas hydrophila TaxID=644 RepID=UPI001269BD01|nr:hypothetical protein [Aeromonas hydrophila]